MKNSVFKHLFLVGACLFLSCQNTPDAPDFPEMDLGYEKPIIKPFRMPEPDTVTREKVQLKALPQLKFDWDKLPSKSFEIGELEPVEKKNVSEAFYLDSLPSSPFDLEKLPENKIKVKVVELGDPEIRKAGSLVKQPGTSRGVLSSNFNFGLSGNPFNIVKDNEGMLWIATNYGIARYDSENIEMYGANQGINVPVITALLVDSKGRIWLASNERLMILDLDRKLILELENLPGKTPVFGLEEDNEGRIWASDAATGYSIIDFDGRSARYFNDSEQGLDPFVTPMQDEDGLMWLTSRKRLRVIDLEKKRTYLIQGEFLKEPIYHVSQGPSNRIWITNGTQVTGIDKKNHQMVHLTISKDTLNIADFVLEDTQGNIWTVSEKGIVKRFLPDLSSSEEFILNDSEAKEVYFPMLEDEEGQIWLTKAMNGGLFKINNKNGRPGNFSVEDGLGANQVWATLQARDGKTWIGTYNGIDVYDPVKKQLTHFGREAGLRAARHTGLTEDAQGRIWTCGNVAGATIIDPEQETIQFLTRTEGIKTDSVRRITQGENGKMWLAGTGGELMAVDLDNSRSEFFDFRNDSISFNDFLEIDLEGDIWVGWRDLGVQKVDLEKNLSYLLTAENGILAGNIFAMDFDENNAAWLAGEKGLQFLKADRDSIYNFSTDQGLAANDVYDVALHKGKVYTGSSKGFNIIDERKSETRGGLLWDVRTIDVNQGLNYLDVSQGSISFDNNDRLWAGVENQILTVIDEIEQDTTASHTYITGLNLTDENKEFHAGSYLKDKRQGFDTIWNSNRDDFIISGNQDNPEEQSDIEWKDLAGPYYLPEELSLPHDENYLSFSYTSLNYDNPGSVFYRYFLEGIDKTWSPISQETTSENYRDLPPGDYTFMVRSKGYNNIWSEPAQFSFSIVPPWWKTWWAYLLYGLLAILILYSIVQYRSQWLKKENRILEERVSERTAQLQKSIHDLENTQAQLIQSEKMASLGELTAGIAHEIQNPLNFVNNFSEVNSELIDELRQERLKDKQERDLELEDELLFDISENEKKIRHHGQRADAIVKGMLQHSRNSSTEKELTDINKLADEYLRLSYHGLRAKDKTFNAGMKTDFDESLPKVYVAPQDIGRVLLNLINNAFYAVSERKKTTSNENYQPMVIVSTEKAGKFININIIDNGRGIPSEVQEKIFQPFFTTKPSGQGTGLGLSLSYDIVKTHGGILKLKTQHGVPVTPNGNTNEFVEEGTTFTIQLPLDLNSRKKKK